MQSDLLEVLRNTVENVFFRSKITVWISDFFYSHDVDTHLKSTNPIKSIPMAAETISLVYEELRFHFSSIFTITVKNS